MVRNLLTRRLASPWAFFLLLWLGFALAGCVQQPLLVANVTPAAGQIAQPTSVSGLPTPIVPHLPPLPPHRGPSDSQAGSGVFRPLDGLADAVACLTDGQPIYAVMQANANVRTQPTVDGCRLARGPAGTLVRVEGLYSQGASRSAPFAQSSRDEHWRSRGRLCRRHPAHFQQYVRHLSRRSAPER